MDVSGRAADSKARLSSQRDRDADRGSNAAPIRTPSRASDDWRFSSPGEADKDLDAFDAA